MTDSHSIKPTGKPSGSLERNSQFATVALGVLLAAAFCPLLLLHVQRLWAKPDSRVLPILVLAALGLLAWRRADELLPLTPGRKGLVWSLLGLCWFLLAVAGILVSSWLGAVAAFLLVLTITYACGGFQLLGKLWPLLLVLGLSVSLPLRYDTSTNARLQTVATRLTSSILDLEHIEHVPLGHFIEIPGKAFSVGTSQAANQGFGISSMYSVLAMTVLLVYAAKIPVLRGISLICTAPLLFLAGNVARALAVIAVYNRWKIDLSWGWLPYLTGIVMLLAILAALVSTNALYSLIGMLVNGIWVVVSKQWRRWRRNRLAWQAITAGEEPRGPGQSSAALEQLSEFEDDAQAKGELRSAFSLVRWPVMVAFGILALLQWNWAWPSLSGALRSRSQLTNKIQETVGPETLSQLLGPKEERKYQAEERSQDLALGKFSKSWTYDLGPNRVVISLDYPFRGRHDSVNEMINHGWVLRRSSILDEEQGPVIEAEFSMPTGLHGLLASRAYDSQGKPIEILSPEAENSWVQPIANFVQNLKIWDPSTREHLRQPYLPSNQVHVFVTSPRPLTNAELKQVRKWLDTACEEIQAAISAESPRTNS